MALTLPITTPLLPHPPPACVRRFTMFRMLTMLHVLTHKLCWTYREQAHGQGAVSQQADPFLKAHFGQAGIKSAAQQTATHSIVS